MKGLLLAWLVGEGIVVYRDVERNHRPPLPGTILGVSGLFVMLALLAEAAPTLAATLGWGLDAAAFLNLAPAIVGGQAGAGAAAGASAGSATGSGAGPGTAKSVS